MTELSMVNRVGTFRPLFVGVAWEIGSYVMLTILVEAHKRQKGQGARSDVK